MSKRVAESEVSPKLQQGKRVKMAEDMQVDSSESRPRSAVKIDEDLHSRQLAVYGRESMARMAHANILLLGVKGLGVEVGTIHSSGGTAQTVAACTASVCPLLY